VKPHHLTAMRASALWLAVAATALAAAPPAVASDAALTLGSEQAGNTLEFTLDELAALPQTTIVTESEFTDGAVEYTGPLVRDVLEHLAIDNSETIRFTAANDYYVDVPSSDFRRYNVILALEADGTRLSRRDKGPLWLMYPLSDHPELNDPVYNTRLIWQVVRIDAL